MGKKVNMNMPKDQNGLNVNINPEDLEDYVCSKCGNQTFIQAFIFKKLSAVMSPMGKDTMIPLQVFKCDECGTIGKEFLPKDAIVND